MNKQTEGRTPAGSGLGMASLLLALVGHFVYYRQFFEASLLAEWIAGVLALFALIAGRGRLPGVAGLVLSLLLIFPNAMRSLHSVRGFTRNSVIGDLRQICSAEAAYASAAQGRFGPLSCLERPSSAGCIPGYPPNAPIFLTADSLGAIKRGEYISKLVPGGSVAGASFTRFCFQARLIPKDGEQAESFGIDERGIMGTAPGAVDCCAADGTLLPVCASRP